MYDRIIVAVNDPFETRAVTVGVEFARSIGARCELAAVVSPGLEERNRAALNELARGLGPMVIARVITDDGRPVAQQVAHLGGVAGALLCLGTTARHAVGEVLLGSVGADVIRYSRHPLLAIGPQCRTRLDGSIVKVAVDGKSAAESIVASAAGLAVSLRARVQFLFVANPAPTTYERRYLHDLTLRATGSKVESSIEFIESSDVRRALLEAFDTPDTLIGAMATHGLGRVERLFAGSVALNVLRSARCPILVSNVAPRTTDL